MQTRQKCLLNMSVPLSGGLHAGPGGNGNCGCQSWCCCSVGRAVSTRAFSYGVWENTGVPILVHLPGTEGKASMWHERRMNAECCYALNLGAVWDLCCLWGVPSLLQLFSFPFALCILRFCAAPSRWLHLSEELSPCCGCKCGCGGDTSTGAGGGGRAVCLSGWGHRGLGAREGRERDQAASPSPPALPAAVLVASGGISGVAGGTDLPSLPI